MSPAISSDILELAEIERSGKPYSIESRKELINRTGIKRYGKDYYKFGNRRIVETLSEISYV